MVDNLNDDEQLQRLREWWQQNWLPLVAGFGLAIAGVLGWNLWQGYQHEQAELASGHYEQLRLNLQMGDMSAAAEQADILKGRYSGTPYAAQAGLLMAGVLVDNDNMERSASELEWVTHYADDSRLQHLGRLRLARVRWAQGESEAALELLADPQLDSFEGLFAELRGDILASQGKDKQARQAYKLAMESAEVSDLAVLQQKLADLAGESKASDTPAEQASQEDGEPGE